MGEAGENHGDGVVRGEGELRLGYVGFKLLDDGGEDGVGQAVEGSPLGVAEGGFHGPDALGGEGSEGGDGEFGGGFGGGGGGGGGRGGLGLLFGWGVRGEVGEDGGEREEEERRGGGGGGVGGGG